MLDLDYRQDVLSDDWFRAKVPHGTEELLNANRQTVRRFVDVVRWQNDRGDPRRTSEQVHFVAERVALRRTYEDLLIPFGFTDERDSQLFTGVLLQIDDFLQAHPDATCTVYQMSKGHERLRSVNDAEEVPTLFQGVNYADGAARKDETYPGDERIRGAQGLTIQIHTLEVRQKNRGDVIARNVPTVAVWVPSSMKRDWLVQEA